MAKNDKQLGKAFRSVIRREDLISSEKPAVREGTSLLMNSTRREIFQYLCKYPCSHLRGISRDLEIAAPTSKWHLTKLEDAGFVSSRSVGRSLVFYPTQFIDGEHVELFSTLTKEKARIVFRVVYENPGITQQEISRASKLNYQAVRWFSKELEKTEVLKIVDDGKYKRHYPTEKLRDLSEAGRRRRKHFREYIIKCLLEDGVAPEVVYSSDAMFQIRIVAGTERALLPIPTNPFTGLLEHDPSVHEEGETVRFGKKAADGLLDPLRNKPKRAASRDVEEEELDPERDIDEAF